MKKMMIAALMLLGTSSAFAGDSNALKAIMKAKTYDEAAQLLNSSLTQLTDNAEKAKAYNHLVELALGIVDKEQAVQIENETAKQMGKESNKPVDEAGMYTALGKAFDAAQECNKYDQLPDAKGKVKPKYGSLADQLYAKRGLLINGGIFYQNAKDDNNAYKFLSDYVETAEWPLFSKFDKSQDANLNEIAYYATYYAYQNKDWSRAEKYVQYALQNPDRAKDAQQLQLAILGSQLQTREDSLSYANKLETLLAQDPENGSILTSLATTYSGLGMQDKAEALVNNALDKNPNNYGALVMKGQYLSMKQEYEGAAEALEKALSLATDDTQKIALNASIGQCYFYRAQNAASKIKGAIVGPAREQLEVVYNKAIGYLEAAKSLDVTREFKSQWAYSLYGCYYFVKGESAPETEQAAQDAGVK